MAARVQVEPFVPRENVRIETDAKATAGSPRAADGHLHDDHVSGSSALPASWAGLGIWAMHAGL